MDAKTCKVGIQLRDDDGTLLPREWLWARVVHEDVRKGVYCLLNTAFLAPFALGDLVEARIQRNGDRLVTALHRRGGRTAHLLVFTARLDVTARLRLAEQWTATGTWVEGSGGDAVTVSVQAPPGGRPTVAELDGLRASGCLTEVIRLADPGELPDDPVFRSLVMAA